jgi:hypothetical protein
LTHALSSAKLDSTRQRRVAELADFTFKIHYKSSKQDSNTDTLSRLSLEIQDVSDEFKEIDGSVELTAVVHAMGDDYSMPNCVVSYCR